MDAIDFGSVTILNSPDVRAWPVTATIGRLELRPTGVRVFYTMPAAVAVWRPVPFGDGQVTFTLWIVLQIGGQWFASGCIEFPPDYIENGGPPTHYAENWYYDANRWGPMTGHQPAAGERVGFLITSGDTRNRGGNLGAMERSNIVTVAFPAGDGPAVYDFTLAPPTPVPPSPPAPAPPPDDVQPLTVLVKELIDAVDQLTEHIGLLLDQLAKLQRDGVKVHL